MTNLRTIEAMALSRIESTVACWVPKTPNQLKQKILSNEKLLLKGLDNYIKRNAPFNYKWGGCKITDIDRPRKKWDVLIRFKAMSNVHGKNDDYLVGRARLAFRDDDVKFDASDINPTNIELSSIAVVLVRPYADEGRPPKELRMVDYDIGGKIK